MGDLQGSRVIHVVFAHQAQDKLINQVLTGFKPTGDVVIKAVYTCILSGQKKTFPFGENRHFQVGVDTIL